MTMTFSVTFSSLQNTNQIHDHDILSDTIKTMTYSHIKQSNSNKIYATKANKCRINYDTFSNSEKKTKKKLHLGIGASSPNEAVLLEVTLGILTN